MARRAVRSEPFRLTPAQARRIYTYNLRVFDRYVRRVKRLPWKAAKRSREIGHLSLFDTLVHILNVQEVWLVHIAQGATEADLRKLFNDKTRHPTDWRGFAAYRRRVTAGIEQYLARLTSKELARPTHVFWMPGRYTVADAILQTTFEEAHHLGEIIGAMWQDDLEPPDMTWLDLARVLQGAQ